MHLTKIDIGWLPPLEDVALDFDKQVNLFVGPNASGKSTILRTIIAMYYLALGEEPPTRYYDDEALVEIANVPLGEDDDGTLYVCDTSGDTRASMNASDDWPRDSTGATKWNEVPFLYIPATRISLSGSQVFGQEIEGSKHIEIDAIREKLVVKTESGGWRLDFNSFLKHAVKVESGVFDARRIESAIDHLAQFMPYLPRNVRDSLERTIEVVGYGCASKICAEVVAGSAPHPHVDNSEELGKTHHFMGIRTSDRTPDTLHARDLSSGTQGTLSWIYALALLMASHYGWAEGWNKQAAILLIDEIENHLHPTWQRRVIPALLKHFPALQIFATTHSPFVVAGLKAGQVHLLKRDANGKVTATTNEQDIVGWTADEILRNLMGVEEPTDQLTVDRMSRLRQLREKESLTAEEETELNELRRQVNEDLLSRGGPLEAQRERYGELMEQFIRSRQAELTQDGD